MTFRFCAVLCGFTVALVSGLTALNVAMHDVRVETRLVKEDPGPPDASIPGAQLNTQLEGLTCDVWQSSTSVRFVCHP